MGINAHVYENDNAGGPVDFTSAVADVPDGTYEWESPPLPLSSDTTFQVRNHDTVTGLEETNTDARVRIRVDAAGNDVSQQPNPPTGLTVTMLSGGDVRLDWQYFPGSQPAAVGFHVYVGSPTPDYGTPAVVGHDPLGAPITSVPYETNAVGFTAVLSGLITVGTTYTGQVGVRAYTPTLEETNTNAVGFTADSGAPLAVDGLTAIAIP